MGTFSDTPSSSSRIREVTKVYMHHPPLVFRSGSRSMNNSGLNFRSVWGSFIVELFSSRLQISEWTFSDAVFNFSPISENLFRCTIPLPDWRSPVRGSQHAYIVWKYFTKVPPVITKLIYEYPQHKLFVKITLVNSKLLLSTNYKLIIIEF